MKVLASVLLLVAVALASEYEVEEGVIVGTQDNFDQIVNDNEFVLAEFYAPWCGHCKALAPEYAKAAQALKSKGSSAVLVKVDATVHSDLGQRFEVRGYPTLKFFKNGKEFEYTGGRTEADIVAWVDKKSGPPAKNIDSADALAKFIDGADVVAVGYFEDDSSDAAKAFVDAADRSEIAYGIVSDASVAASKDIGANKVVVFKKFDEGRVEYDGAMEGEAIHAFVSANELPLLVEFSDQTAPKIFGGDVKTHLLFFNDGNDDKTADIKKAVSAVAPGYKGKIIFISLDSSNDDNMRVLDYFGITAKDVPTLRLINIEGDMAKYKPEFTDITEDNVRDFCQQYVDGKLSRHLMAEDVPEDWDAKPVKVLTGKNFKEVALDDSKNVFVEFYAPWCGHCKQLAPIWDKLGEKYEGVDNVVVAKLDSTANELEEVQVQSFPTIKLFPANGGDVIDYEGSRTIKGFVEFLNKHSGANVEVGEDDDAGAEEDSEDYEEDYDYEEGAEHDEL